MNIGTPTFSLAYTSVRPAILPQIVKLWDERSKNHDHEWCLSVDAGHAEAKASAVAVAEQRGGKYPVKVAENAGRKNCVDGWNAAAAATTGKVIIAVADDFVPPMHWDEQLLVLQPEGWADGEHVVHVNDGFIGHIFTLAILTRKRYDRFGYLWYPGYESMFVDTEFGEVAKRDGVVIEAMHLLFEHMHHACGKRPKDSADANHENNVRWKRGEMLFNYRKERGFPVDLGPRTEPEPIIKKVQPPVALIQVNKPDGLFEACQRLVDNNVKTFYFTVLTEDATGSKPADGFLEFLKSVAAAAERLNGIQGVKVNTKILRVPMYRFPGDTWADVVKRLDADALAWVKADGNDENIVYTSTDTLQK